MIDDPEWWIEKKRLVISVYLETLKRFIDEGNSFEDSVRLTCEKIMNSTEKQ